ncbi:DUF6111 family protein [Azospirillum sp.]|uniref:DUF6111 family protein n=1 Tax=Azospirillum sp. TaxID=34012 RepID=UPI002D714335|nr:DUF6111 family protein [Azospirillum sp.]HYD70202.1 DUF6111 family protein [Azospirillum sp.]
MLRILLTIVLPLALPTVVYLLYVTTVEARRVRAAQEGGPVPWWVEAPWPWLVGGGVLLTGLTLGVMALTGGDAPGEVYVPAHMEDGRLVPGATRPAPTAAPGH